MPDSKDEMHGSFQPRRKLVCLASSFWRSTLASQVCIGVLFIAVLELILHIGAGEAVLFDSALNKPVRWSIVSWDLFLATLFVSAAISTWSVLTASNSVFLRAAGILWLGSAWVFWVASWALQYLWGMFLGPEVILFAASRPVQFLLHLPFVGLLLLLAVAIILGRLGHELLIWVSTFKHRILSQIVAVIFVAAIVAGFVFGPSAGHDLESQFALGLRGGVFTALTSTQSKRLAAMERWIISMSSERLRRDARPILPWQEYLSLVDSGDLARLNVLVVVIESLRPDQLQSLGSSRPVMPNLDGLAEKSIVLTNAYSQASHSDYADPSILSSHYPLRSLRAHVYPKNPSYPRVLIYDILKHAGWRTAIISSQNELWGNMLYYFDTGNLDHLHHAETWEGPTYVQKEDTGFATFVDKYKRSGKVDDRYTMDEALDWISEGGEPFFVYMNLQASHFPYYIPQGFQRPFGPSSVDFVMAFNSVPRNKLHVVKDLYADSLHYVDTQLGRLLTFLKNSGQLDETMVVVTGDTGQAFLEHDFAAHGNALFNEVVHVPVVLWVPGERPARIGHVTQHIDIPPTILQVLGFPPHPSFQGSSVLDDGRVNEKSAYIVVQTPLAHQYAIVRDGFKLIYDANRGRYHLFDLVNDAQEQEAVNSELPDRVSSLSERLFTWMTVQLEYYANQSLHKQVYPPVLDERDPN